MHARQSVTVAGVQGLTVRRARRRVGRGFTLLEAALATVIIGVGVLALIQAQAVFVATNDWSSQNATGSYLCNELRERIRRMPRHDPVTGLYLDAGNVLRGWGPEPNETQPIDYNDVDDWDGKSFGAGGTNTGPIDAECRVVPRVGLDGVPVVAEGGGTVPLDGWTQTVSVQKVDPFNFSIVRSPEYARAAAGTVPALAVDKFPLKVTVTAYFQGTGDTVRREMAKVTWIQP